MANEVFFDTSGFFMLMDERDALHQKAVEWLRSHRGQVRPVTTEWVVGETCTLLVARKRPHLVTKFLDYLDRSAALLLINPDETLLRSAKAMIRRQAEQGYSFVDCVSFCLMSERKIAKALTTDTHFQKAGFTAVLV
ncbi:MAG TPA: PIN domain-containing protein [Terrimicrobiaceae bacterium]